MPLKNVLDCVKKEYSTLKDWLEFGKVRSFTHNLFHHSNQIINYYGVWSCYMRTFWNIDLIIDDKKNWLEWKCLGNEKNQLNGEKETWITHVNSNFKNRFYYEKYVNINVKKKK